MSIKQNQVFLFQGDSITDSGRNRAVQHQANDGEALGGGYAGQLAKALLADYPKLGLQMFNRGISGDRVVDLYARWKVDGVNLQPDWISILVGVNDCGKEFVFQDGVELDRFEQVYRMLLEYTRAKLPEVRLVLCDPFLIPCASITSEWHDDIRERQAIVARLSDEFGAVRVPFQEMFDEALKEAPAQEWAGDGVHPSEAGHARMVKLWRSCVGI